MDHHRQVPYRLLRCHNKLSAGDADSGNLLIEGDNLHALKALLPYYAGKVKCIYIDPPYNTGNENWVYNDAANSPEIREWLGKTVGKEAEDLSRHAKWACMMYPRLALLRDFLTEDGAIFISIDDNEVHHLRCLMDELFGARNFVASVIWQKVYSPKNSAKHFSEDHDFIIVYAKNANFWKPNLITRSNEQDKAYKNPDNDPRGPWKTSDLSARNPYNAGTYSITCPSGRVIESPPKGRYWSISKAKLKELDSDNRIWWGNNGNAKPQVKRFLSEVQQGRVPQTLWNYKDVGHTQDAKKELVALCDFEDSASVFITPKPSRLVKRILEIATDKDSIILDSFAGSGTTGHAVLTLNQADGGSRRCIQVEMDSNICQNVAAQRLKRVISGYTWKNGQGKTKEIPGTGGGFRYCKLANPLFDESGQISEEVRFADLAAHVFFTETGSPLPKRVNGKSPYIGAFDGTAYYLLFNGVLGDKRPNGGNVLTSAILESLPAYNGPKIVYGEGCRLGTARLKREGIQFKQLPYEVRSS